MSRKRSRDVRCGRDTASVYEANRQRAKEVCQSVSEMQQRRVAKCKLTVLHGVLTGKERRAHRIRRFIKALRRLDEVKAFIRRSGLKQKRTKGAIQSNRGVFNEDALVSARYDRLILDTSCLVMGDGYFDEDTGQFVSVGTHVYHFVNRFIRDGEGRVLRDAEGNPVTRSIRREGPEDFGPTIPGDKFVRFGKGRTPNSDIKRHDAELIFERNKDLASIQRWDAWTGRGRADPNDY